MCNLKLSSVVSKSSRLKFVDTLPCPVADLLSQYPSIPKEAVIAIRLCGLSKIISTPGYTQARYVEEIDNQLKQNGGNWLALICHNHTVDKVGYHHALVLLYVCVYEYYLKITHEPLFAFRNTIELDADIHAFVEVFLEECENAGPDKIVYTTEHAICNVARQLVDTGAITGWIRFIEKSHQPRITVS